MKILSPSMMRLALALALASLVVSTSINCSGPAPASIPTSTGLPPSRPVAAAAPAPASTVWTVDDIMKVTRFGQAEVSPDGKIVAYVMARAVMTETKSENDLQIYVADSDGKEARQLTRGDGVSTYPRWSPDSRQIAFLSTRSGRSNVWLISPHGGEAKQLTDAATGVADFGWSPSGCVKRSPLSYVKNVATPTLIRHGEDDDRVPHAQGVLLYNALKDLGVTVQMVSYPRSGHTVSEPKLARDVMERVLEWFGKYLPPDR